MRYLTSALAFTAAALSTLPSPALAWGKTGHRVVGAIADPLLTPAARTGVRSILGVETMAEASNWPDFMRSSPDAYWQHSTPWHYVTVPPGKTYAQVTPPPEGDAVTALKGFTATVKDKSKPLVERQAALRFIIHIIGDLHQPLHAGKGDDKGGNEVAVTFFGRPTNLHSVWDSGLIDDEQLSYSELAAWLSARITPADRRAWASTDPAVWIKESTALRDQIYPSDPALSYTYIYQNKARVELRLEMGGVRLADYLNTLFQPVAKRR
ncbi:S1/P1 nuclease [Sphingomonas sp. Mn802worker]|uniref:S1/P1 nuclease n=1 Tax=Sphingomonas sp. Mn802worker TaxID=629773 RepID=UPI000477361F|nr:S1/P1 nuclease [Sphingomonas sp. Mn802worker]